MASTDIQWRRPRHGARATALHRHDQFRLFEAQSYRWSSGQAHIAKVVGLRVGTFRQRDRLVPTDQFWFRSAQAWLHDLPHMKKTEKQPVLDAKGAISREETISSTPCGTSPHGEDTAPGLFAEISVLAMAHQVQEHCRGSSYLMSLAPLVARLAGSPTVRSSRTTWASYSWVSQGLWPMRRTSQKRLVRTRGWRDCSVVVEEENGTEIGCVLVNVG